MTNELPSDSGAGFDPLMFRDCVIELRSLLLDSLHRFRHTEGFRKLMDARKKKLISIESEATSASSALVEATPMAIASFENPTSLLTLMSNSTRSFVVPTTTDDTA